MKRIGSHELATPPARASHRNQPPPATDLLVDSHGLAGGQIQRGVRVRRSGRLLVNRATRVPTIKRSRNPGFPTHIPALLQFARPNCQKPATTLATSVPSAIICKVSRIPSFYNVWEDAIFEALSFFFQRGKKLQAIIQKFSLHLGGIRD